MGSLSSPPTKPATLTGAPQSGKMLKVVGRYAANGITDVEYNGKILLSRVVVGSPLAISALVLNVFTGVAAKVVRVGIYNDVGGLPGALLVDAGTATLDAAAAKEIAVSTTLAPGAYWLAMLTDATATAVFGSTGNSNGPGVPDAVGNGACGYSGTQAYGALPAALPALVPLSVGPGFFLKAA